MKGSFLAFLIVMPLFVFSNRRPRYLPEYSYSNVKIKSCYRWVSDAEKKKWKKKAFLPKVSKQIRNHLGRAYKSKNMTFCWSNPITTISGGIGETYGINLLRIDLTDDHILYDRNQDKYFQFGEEITPTNAQRKGVDTEVVYGLYHLFGEDQFQEYAIHSTKAIKSWSFDDEELILEWHTNMDFYFNAREELPMEDWHFLKFACTDQEDDYSYKAQDIWCRKYKKDIVLRNKHLFNVWN